MSQYIVVNPANGDIGSEFAQISDDELAARTSSASTAHESWSKNTTVDERAAFVQRVAELHSERRQQLAEIAVREMGKPISQALGEVDFSSDIYSYYAENAKDFLRDEPITLRAGGGSALIRRTSVGVLLGIMPWNFPYYQVARFAGPNLTIGNTLLLKHAPQCPESAAAIQQIFVDAGLPSGVYNNIYASNQQVERIIADPRIQGVSLTGSERAGAAVAEIAGRNLKKVVLELGGSDPFILLSTRDLSAVVEAAVFARMDNNGQSCNAAKRFVIASKYYEEFVEQFTAAFINIRPGDPIEESTALGPLSSAAAADRLQAQIDRATAEGAVAVGSGERSGTYFAPVVLTNVTADNGAYNEEFFGPVAVIHRADSEEQAVTIANDTPFGLGAYVFSDDKEQALRVADRLETGMVFINVVGADGAELPFGGVKRSGFGRELGRLGSEEFVNKKLIRIG